MWLGLARAPLRYLSPNWRDGLLRSSPLTFVPPPLSVVGVAAASRFKSRNSKKVDLSHLIPEEELREEFVTGSGPGGQAVNKARNAVFLKHIPTGVFVKCHETRSAGVNRELARKYLAEKVDLHLHGEESQLSIKQKEKTEEKLRKKAENKRTLELQRAYKEMLAKEAAELGSRGGSGSGGGSAD